MKGSVTSLADNKNPANTRNPRHSFAKAFLKGPLLSMFCQNHGSTGGKKESAMDKRSCFMENKVWKGLIFNLNMMGGKLRVMHMKKHACVCVCSVNTIICEANPIMGTYGNSSSG